MNIFQDIIDEINIEKSVKEGSERNDLLPERFEDKVTGEIAKSFSEGLKSRIERGRYEPCPAVFISVPKPGNTTRPAALLTLSDRIVYFALVRELQSRVETGLLGKEIVFFPRGIPQNKRWREFEKSPIEQEDLKYVAQADITGFYESIDHELLRHALIDLTGKREVVNGLIEFLNRIMRTNKGIPQGLLPSDTLATAYLSTVDSAMVRHGFHYWRHGDDIRVATSEFSAAREALYVFESELRRLGILVNNPKSVILKMANYKDFFDQSAQLATQTKRELLAEKIERLKADGNAMVDILTEIDRPDLGWDLFYHGDKTVEEVIDEIKESIQPKDTEIAERIFKQAMTKRPGSFSALTKEDFHFRITTTLVRLAAARSKVALEFCHTILTEYPEKTSIVAEYLKAISTTSPNEVAELITNTLRTSQFRTDWETSWLLRVLANCGIASIQPHINLISEISANPDTPAMTKVEAIKILGKTNNLEHMTIKRLWNTISTCFHPDLTSAVFLLPESTTWRAPFLSGCKENPILTVVLKHLDQSLNSAAA